MTLVVARVLAIRAHPNADRIRLVDVDAGDGEPLQIVCGAWNFEVGDLVPLAPAGTVLPGGREICPAQDAGGDVQRDVVLGRGAAPARSRRRPRTG